MLTRSDKPTISVRLASKAAISLRASTIAAANSCIARPSKKMACIILLGLGYAVKTGKCAGICSPTPRLPNARGIGNAVEGSQGSEPRLTQRRAKVKS